MPRWRFDVLAALNEIGAGTPAKVAKAAKVEGLTNRYFTSAAAKVAKAAKVESSVEENYTAVATAKVTKLAKVESGFQRISFGHDLTVIDRVSFDGVFPDFDRVAATLLKQESPEEKTYNDRLAKEDGWNPPMVPVPFFFDPPIAPPTTPTVGKVLPLVTKPVAAKVVTDPDLDFVRSALTANIFAASRARGLTLRLDANGDIIVQGKGLTERDRLLFEPHEAAIAEALNP